MVLIGCLVLLYFALRYRNISRESLEILKELKETRSDLQQALQKAGTLSPREQVPRLDLMGLVPEFVLDLSYHTF